MLQTPEWDEVLINRQTHQYLYFTILFYGKKGVIFMPRKKPTRKDNRYEYKITIGRNIHGKPLRKSFYSTVSLADAKRKAEEFRVASEVSARTGEAFVRKNYNFAQWAQKWLTTYKQPFVRYNTYQTYEEIVRLYLEPYFGSVDLTDVRPVDVQNFAAMHRGLSASHLKKIRLCLVDIFETAIENDLCYKNPAKRVQFSSSARKRVKRVLTEKQIAIVREEALEEFPAAALLLDTGMRRGELLGTMWTDFVLEPGNGSLHIQRTVVSEVGVLKLAAPKKNSFRTIPISDECIALVQSLPHDGLYLFPSQTGGLQDTDHFSQRLKKFMRGVHERHPDIPPLTSHEMRHTYGTSLRRHGVDIYTIQKILGHKDINVTADTYVHNELDELRAAVFPKKNDDAREETTS